MRAGLAHFGLAATLLLTRCALSAEDARLDAGGGERDVMEQDVRPEAGGGERSLIERTTPAHHNVTMTLTATRTGEDLETLYLFFVMPQTNAYQDIADYRYDPERARVVHADAGEDRILVYTLSGDALPAVGRSRAWSVEFELTTYTIVTNTDVITEIFDHEPDSDIYRTYTGVYPDFSWVEDPWIDPWNEEVAQAAADLWSRSSDALDFTRRAYRYVPDRLDYAWDPAGGNPRTVAEILDAGACGCGGYAVLFMSLLRNRGIPCRFLYASGLEDGAFHGWAEAYFESWGWIPVDATSPDFRDLPFGRIGQGRGNAPIVSHGDPIWVDGMPLLGLQLPSGFSFQPDYEVSLSVQSEETESGDGP